MKYGELTLGQVEAIVNKLGGMDGVRQFLSGKTTVKAVAEFVPEPFKTIKLGTFTNWDEIRGALKTTEFCISNAISDMLGNPALTLAPAVIEVDLVVVSVAELGFKGGATQEQIYERVQELGLELCPAEVGPQLRLQHLDQPVGENLTVGMEPITEPDGNSYLFYVICDEDGLCLSRAFANPTYYWPGPCRWVFLRRE